MKIIGRSTAVGISSGIVITVLAFALNAYVEGIVKAQTKAAFASVPTIATLNGQLNTINNNLSNNTKAISELKRSQDEFQLLFIEYLQQEAKR